MKHGAKGSLPLILTPEKAEGPEALAGQLKAQFSEVENLLTQHGAILFRGIPLSGALDFERVALAVTAELKNNYLGTSPRDAVTEYVFNASELPGYYPIPQHCEMTFIKDPPKRLLFACLVAPSGSGGETPLCDFRKVLADLPAEVREPFERLGVRTVRNYSGPSSARSLGPWQLKPWHELFGTRDKDQIEKICKENNFEPTWLPGDKLRLEHTQKATRLHPLTGEPVWFNHSQVFHMSQARGEFARIAKRQPSLRLHGLKWYARLLSHAQQRLLEPDAQPMHSTYGDGTEIPDASMEAVRDAIWKNLVTFRWHRGDIVLIDNHAIAHGRMPYQGPRRVVVAWN